MVFSLMEKDINMGGKKTNIVNGQITCNLCEETKDLIHFHKTEFGYRNRCRRCRAKDGSKMDWQSKTEGLFLQGKKECNTCKIVKTIDCFSKHKYERNGLRSMCKACTSLKVKGSIGQRKSWLKSRYNISLDNYNKMFEDQKGQCFICSTDLLLLDKRHVHVDHCHETNLVRGLLCNMCNHGIGNFKDDIELLNNAISYLKRFTND